LVTNLSFTYIFAVICRCFIRDYVIIFQNNYLQRFVFTAFLFIFVFQKQFLLCGHL
jgi:hypothetical protein